MISEDQLVRSFLIAATFATAVKLGLWLYHCQVETDPFTHASWHCFLHGHMHEIKHSNDL